MKENSEGEKDADLKESDTSFWPSEGGAIIEAVGSSYLREIFSWFVLRKTKAAFDLALKVLMQWS